MKRMFTALIASAMLLLAGCSSGNSDPTNVASVDTAASNVGEAASEGSESAAEENAVTLDETVIYDGNDIKITATGIKEDSFFGPELNLLIENNGTQNIVVQPDYCLVNGYMMYGLMSSDVAAGKKNNDTMVFSGSTLKVCGIDQIADIRLRLTVIDSDSWMPLFKTDEITLQTSAAGTYTQTYDDSGEVIYDTNGIKVVAKSADDEFLGKGVVFYLENNTDRHVVVNGENISVNGYMMTDLFYADLAPQSHAVDILTLLSSDLQNNAIDTIEEVDLTLRITDYDSYDNIDTTSPITLHF